jgi:hypothetical protein
MGAAPSTTVQTKHPTIERRKIEYNINDKVSFLQDELEIIGRVISINCEFYVDAAGNTDGNLCDMNRSTISIIDDKNTTYTVPLNTPTLKIKNMTIDEARKMYIKGRKVHFMHQNEPKTGIITGIGLTTVNEYISDKDSIHVILDGSKDIVRIPLTDPTLQLVEVPIPVSGKQKYTLEEDSKYRVKYMKYKAKYLAQKNN